MNYSGTDHHRTMYLLDSEQRFGRSFLEVFPFSEGCGAVRDKGGAYYIDPEGRPLFQKKFKHAYPFVNGIAAVEDELGMFHIDRDGKELYTRRFGWVSNFSEGLCAVMYRNGAYTYIDTSGRNSEKTFRHCGDFENGSSVVLDDEGFTHIDHTLGSVHGLHFLYCHGYGGLYAPVETESGWHLIDRAGKFVTEAYDRIDKDRNGLLTAVKGGCLGYLDNSLQWHKLFRLQEKVDYDEMPDWTDDILDREWDSCVVYMRHSERRSHFLCNDRNIAGTGLTAHGDELARSIGRKISALNNRNVTGRCSSSRRCLTTANCIMGAMGVQSQIETVEEVGPMGTAFIYDHNFSTEDLRIPSIIACFDQINGHTLNGWYENEEICRRMLDLIKGYLSKDDSLTFCVNHDLFVIPLVAYLAGRYPRNEGIEYCEGALFIRKGKEYRMVWKGREYPMDVPGKIQVDISKSESDVIMNLPEPEGVKGWTWEAPEDIAWMSECSDGMYTLCDKEGRFFHGRSDEYLVGNRTFSFAKEFSEQSAPVYIEGRGASFITDFGDFLNNRWFIEACAYSEGLAPVEDDEGWHYVDVDGVVRIDGPFDICCRFHHGQALAIMKGRPCIVHHDGETTGL